MAEVVIRRVPEGVEVDGLLLRQGKCAGSGDPGAEGAAGMACCYTYSTVTWEGNLIAFFAKMTTPTSPHPYEWGYRVRKGGVVVDVLVYDSREPRPATLGGHYPPPLSAWEARGWEVLSRFEGSLDYSPTE
jgi:hypothetical protein